MVVINHHIIIFLVEDIRVDNNYHLFIKGDDLIIYMVIGISHSHKGPTFGDTRIDGGRIIIDKYIR